MEPKDLVITRFDAYFLVPATKEARSAARDYGKVVGKTSHGLKSTETLVGCTTIPASLKSRRYIVDFHIDEMLEDEKRGREFYCHASYRTKPHSPPPKKVTDLHAAGCTTESVSAWIAEFLGSSPVSMILETRASIPTSYRDNFGEAPSLPVGTETLAPVGAEYAPVKPGKVRRLRWRERKGDDEGTIDIWVDHLSKRKWSKRPWTQEKKALQTLLSSLL